MKMRIRRHVSLTLDGELVRRIDEMRGYITRSVFVELLLRRALQEGVSIQGSRSPEGVGAGASGDLGGGVPHDGKRK